MSAMECTEVRALVARYLDDELEEVQAAPMRAHLLACLACRAVLQEGKSLEAWFVPPEPVAIPEGFAARVAHRAETGDRGALVSIPMPLAGPAPLEKEEQRESIRPFVLSAIAIAALVLLVLSIALRRLELPGGEGLEAKDTSREQAVEALEGLNDREADE
jgi:anti-sigma factor RsiW